MQLIKNYVLSKISDTLFEFLKEKDISVYKFSQETGIPESRVRQWKRGKGNPKQEDTVTIMLYLKLNRFQGDYGVDLKDEPVLGESTENKTYQQERFQKKMDEADNTAPLVPVKAQAGYSRAYDQSEYIDSLEKYALPPGITRHGAIWRYWEIEGDSMLPTFKNRDIILTSQVHEMDWDQLRNFYCYIIVTDEHVFYKRVFIDGDRWVLISDNEDAGYEQFAIDPKTVKEVWVFRRHIDSSAPVPKEFKIKI